MTVVAIAVFAHLANVTDGHRIDGFVIAIDDYIAEQFSLNERERERGAMNLHCVYRIKRARSHEDTY